jgi:hypothetical protein
MTGSMLRRLVRGLTFANVCSAVALLVALGTGGAYAAGTIDSHDIKNKSIRSVDIKNGQVKNADLGPGSVTATDLHADAVNGSKILDGTVANAELATDAVTGAKVADNSIGVADIIGVEQSGTVSISGISNGRCSQVSFAISGAAVGQAAQVSTGAAIQEGIVLYAQRVSAPNVVEVDVCNFSGGAMTAISGFPVRVFTFG